MVYLILGWLILGLLSTIVGDRFLALTFPESQDSNTPDSSKLLNHDRILLSIWLGLGTIALVLLALSLVTPLTPVVGLGLGSLCLTIAAIKRQFGAIGWQWKPKALLGWSLAIVGTAAWCNRPVVWHDTGYYHVSLIQWLGEYGTVPGLALLFNNLGFTSSWFSLVTPFNPTMLGGRPLALANGFVFLLLLLQGVAGMKGWQSGRSGLADRFSLAWSVLMIPIVLFLDPFSKILRSPSPDLPVTLLVGVIAWAMLLLKDYQQTVGRSLQFHEQLLPLGLASVAVTFKLIALPLIPVTFLFAIWRQGFGAYLKAIGLCGLILSPMIAGNLLTSGCPLYPGHVLCLPLPWSPTRSSLEAAALITHGWTSWYGTPPPGANPWIWAIGQWFMQSPKEKITAFGILLSLLVALVLIVKILRKNGGKAIVTQLITQLNQRGELWLCGLGIGGLGFVMAMSPFFRFSAPYIGVLGAIGLAQMFNQSSKNSGLSIAPESVSAPESISGPSKFQVVLTLGFVALCLSLESRAFWIPPALQFSSVWVQKETNGITYRSPRSGDVNEEAFPKKDMCWTAELPCAYNISSDIHLRDPAKGIGGGFVRR